MSKFMAAMAVSMVAAAAATAYPETQTHSVEVPEPQAVSGDRDLFVLASPGQAGCNVRRGIQRSGPSAELIFDGVCTAVYPELAYAKVWHETRDGSVVFADPKGRTVVEFSAADGEGYESVVPAAQLLHLMPTGPSYAGVEMNPKG